MCPEGIAPDFLKSTSRIVQELRALYRMPHLQSLDNYLFFYYAILLSSYAKREVSCYKENALLMDTKYTNAMETLLSNNEIITRNGFTIIVILIWIRFFWVKIFVIFINWRLKKLSINIYKCFRGWWREEIKSNCSNRTKSNVQLNCQSGDHGLDESCHIFCFIMLVLAIVRYWLLTKIQIWEGYHKSYSQMWYAIYDA